MDAWGWYGLPSEPVTWEDHLIEAHYRALEAREMEWDARPTYEEMMEMDDNAVEEELCP